MQDLCVLFQGEFRAQFEASWALVNLGKERISEENQIIKHVNNSSWRKSQSDTGNNSLQRIA